MHRRYRGDHTDRGRGHGAQGGDLALLVGANLDHNGLVIGRQLEEGQRQPPLVVEGAFRLQHSPAGPEHRGDHLLRRRLAVGAGDRDHRDGEALTVVRGDVTEGSRRILHEDERHASRDRIGDVVHETRGPATRRFRHEVVAVEPMALDGEECLADTERTGIDGDATDGHREVPDDERALSRANDVLDGEGRHRQPAIRWRTWRATSRSSKGSTSAPMIWYVSCPLPAITTVSPERAQSSAAPMAVRRSTSRP